MFLFYFDSLVFSVLSASPGFLACDCSRLCSPPGSYFSPVPSSVCCFHVSGVPGFHVFSFPSLGFLKLVSHLSGFSCSDHFLFSGINKRHVSFTTFPLHMVTLTGVRCQKKDLMPLSLKTLTLYYLNTILMHVCAVLGLAWRIKVWSPK